MKLAILVFSKERKELQPGTQMIFNKALERGHKVDIICDRDLQIRFNGKTKILHKGKPLIKYDAIFVRPLFNHDPSIHSAVIRQFELNGYLVINGYLGVHRAKNKIRTLQLLAHHNLPMPKTTLLFDEEHLKTALKDFKFPVVVKAAYGSGGAGIFICATLRAVAPVAEHLLKADNASNDPIKIQEYIAEAKGKDLRLFVVGKQVVATMERKAKKGEFRANFHKGGSVKGIQPTKKEERLAIAAAKEMGLNVSGVDILRSKHGPLILEVNSAPGLEGITQATGIDIAGEIIKYIERRAKKHQSRKKLKEYASKKSEA
jgi:ribosomal protein S6--L-glutamate ligase